MKRNFALIAGAAAGTVTALLLRRRKPPAALEGDPRAEELRRKLAQAREEAADEDDFAAAGMGAETLVEDEAAGEVDETRARVHRRARSTAEEMRGEDPPDAA